MIEVGEKLTDFILKDQDNADFKSEEHRGKKLLLSFHPLAFTPICADQMKALEEHYERFEELGTLPVGISIDQPFAKAAWAESIGVENVRLLCDFWPHGQLAQTLGIFIKEKGISQRANIIVDEKGEVIFTKVYEISQLPDINEIIEFLEK